MTWTRALVALGLFGCSTASAVPTDAGVDAPVDAGYPGPHPAAPQVENQHGPVLATPRVVPIFFANDAEQSKVEDFLQQLAASSYWSAATSEYGVGPLTIASSVVSTDSPPATIDTAGIEAWLAGFADGNSSDVFAIFYPAATTVSDALFGTSCTDFNGFHFQGLQNTQIVYAVLPRCASAGALVGLDALTATLSHELVEAATDPFLQTAPAWGFTDVNHIIWSVEPGAEVADMCTLEPQSFQRLVGTYMVQRSWSNASALAGHDPCVPAPAQPYFNAAPVLNAQQPITFGTQELTTEGIQLEVGESKTIAVQLFSDAPTSDWSVDAVDVNQPSSFTFSWDAPTGNNGDTLHLTITRTGTSSSELAIESTAGTTTNLWFEYVSQ